VTNPREQWASSTGFILATIGSAVGIGNIWRFSYVAGENGGGAFLIIYLACVLIVGMPIVMAEMAMGRRGGGDAIAATMLVVMGGVRRGIEAANRILMPLLALVVIVLAVYASTLSGSAAGWKFLFVPDWAAFGEPQVYIAAVGQAFFSLGIGMAVFITYASYMTSDIKIPAPRPRSSPGIPFSRLSPGSPFFRPCSRSAATRRPARNSPSSRCRRFF